MARLLRSFFYKLFHDVTFRIVAIVGVALAFLFSLFYCFVSKGFMASGGYSLISSISPYSNFGIAIPINLGIFLSLLFSQGIIRNEVIVGNSKAKVYLSLLIGGTAFVLSLMLIYSGLTTLLSSLFCGFYNNEFTTAFLSQENLVKVIIVTILNYSTIAAWTVFISSQLRSTGSIVSLTIIPIIFFSIFSMIVTLMQHSGVASEGLVQFNRIFNPQYLMGRLSGLMTLFESTITVQVDTSDMVIGVVNNVAYIALFTIIGMILFKKRDLK